MFLPFQFLLVHKSHSSFHSTIAFQHIVLLLLILIVHFFVQLFLLFFVQLSVQSSHSSPNSTVPFQHFEVVFLHSKEHFQSYQFLSQLSHTSQISIFPFQQVAEHFSHRSTGQVLQVSPGSIFQFPQFGFNGLYIVHITVHRLLIFQFLLHLSHCSYSSFVPSQHL
jgi:hypothetical protein